MKCPIVIIKKDVFKYPSDAPFLAGDDYPEIDREFISGKTNAVFCMVREAFSLMGYDAGNFGKKTWNPLGKLIRPGDQVLIKPNMVMDKNHNEFGGTECLYTNPSVVAAVLIYTIKALKGNGTVIVGDAPMQECDFGRLVDESGYLEMINFFKLKVPDGVSIDLIDFRDLHSEVKFGVHKQYINKITNGVAVDLGAESEFAGLSTKEFLNLRITNYNPSELIKHHNEKKNEYLINANVLKADVIINIPKPKTHRKAGVTIALKNAVGINSRKEYLPHHTNGAKEDGGDEYLIHSQKKIILDELYDVRNTFSAQGKYFRAFIFKIAIKFIRMTIKHNDLDNYYEGSWYGNNTINKTIVDLNKIIFYSDKNGKMKNKKQRKYLVVGDMIVSGEKEGPVAPSPKEVGMIAVGENPVCYDELIAFLMGADISRIPSLTLSRKSKSQYKIVDDGDIPYVISNDSTLNGKCINDLDKKEILYFTPTSGWEKVFIKNDEL